MENGNIYVYYGEGKGKTTSALGRGLRAISKEQTVILIRFLDSFMDTEVSFFKRLEPDFKVFSFEKPRAKGESIESYNERLRTDVKTAFFFANKIIDTEECDVLILDGITEAIEQKLIPCQDFCRLLDKRPQGMELVLTGRVISEEIFEKSDFVYHIAVEKLPESY